jgi:leucyl/phenylalanyl-tRNA---protein transferase
MLLLAYRDGIFPMADSRDDPEVFWIEPRMRAIIPLGSLHISHSLAKTLRRGRFEVTCNAAFSRVVEMCAAPRADAADGNEGSWISHRIEDSYVNLHHLGLAHSIECWQHGAEGSRGELVGGLYGVGFDGVFCGESMFSRATDASKVALCWLVAAMRRAGATLLDCQFMTPHLASMGAVEMPQKQYLKLLKAAQAAPSSSGSAGAATGSASGSVGAALSVADGFAALLADAEAPGLSGVDTGKFIAHFLTQTS